MKRTRIMSTVLVLVLAITGYVCFAAPTEVSITSNDSRSETSRLSTGVWDSGGLDVHPEQFAASIGILSATEDINAILIDLDSTEYPHSASKSRIDITALEVSATVGSGGVYVMRVGHVLIADATDGNVVWGAPVYLQAGTTNTAVTYKNNFRGTISSGAVTGYVSDDTDVDQSWLQTDGAALADAIGNATASAGAGDVVIKLDEISGSATASAYVRGTYVAR